jgi:hypothetical protein
VRAAGLEPVKIHYFFGLLFPVAAVLRLGKKLLLKAGAVEAKSELSVAPGWLNSLLVGVHRLEQRLLFPVNRIAGLTVFCLCRKPDERSKN